MTATFVVDATELNGDPATGKVSLQVIAGGVAVEQITNDSLGVKVGSQTLPLEGGALSIDLVPTDDTDWTPSPRQYRVQLLLDTGWLAAKTFSLPDGATVKYSELA